MTAATAARNGTLTLVVNSRCDQNTRHTSPHRHIIASNVMHVLARCPGRSS